MSTPIRLAVVAYVLGLSLALVIGHWPLEGPLLLGARHPHGRTRVVIPTVVACVVVLRSD